MDFSLFFFSSHHDRDRTAYELLHEAAKLADRGGFHAIWIPERHFRPFGAPFPNPAVIAASLTAITERLRLNAGSVVVPLHDPLRLVEEWSVVDVLSNGRVGLSFASGWHADDFVLAPDRYETRRTELARDIARVRQLWSGGTIERINGAGKLRPVRTFPRPIQDQLSCWITSSRSNATVDLAGELGANLLLHLLYQDVAEMAKKVTRYREVRRAHGHDRGRVTLVMHTYVSDDERLEDTIRGPLSRYLHASIELDLVGQEAGREGSEAAVPESDRELIVERTIEHLFDGNSLLCQPRRAVEVARHVAEAGADEIACLIDFGMPVGDVLKSLRRLELVRLSAEHAVGVGI